MLHVVVGMHEAVVVMRKEHMLLIESGAELVGCVSHVQMIVQNNVGVN